MRKWWFGELLAPILIALIMLVAMVLAWVLLPPAPQKPYRHVTTAFPADAFYQSLSDSVANRFARQALDAQGYDLREWRTIKIGESPDIYLHRINQNEAFLFFERGRETLTVHVRLEPQGNLISCTVNSKTSQSK